MIISRTPFRISFFGGGTDYPDWYRKHGGAVLSTTFDKYCYISARHLPPFFDHKYRITYSKVEDTKAIAEIQHPAIRAVLEESSYPDGLEIHCDADLPARSGLGSSSSFVVGLLQSLQTLMGTSLEKKALAEEAIRIEQQVLQENVGSQDQVAAAHGGLNLIEFKQDDTFKVNPIELIPQRLAELESHLMLFFTGLSRIASKVAKSKILNLHQRSDQLHRMRNQVNEALHLLQSTEDIRGFGEMLHQTWLDKRALSDQVSNETIDAIYDDARKSGAIGGKLLGAGGGGFLLIFAEPRKHNFIRQSLNELVEVPVKFENSGCVMLNYKFPDYVK
jgi:D-glycero-alpha-D-manno-heptose-7-phosphate kinase